MLKGEKMSQEQKLKVSHSRKGKGLGNTNGFKKGQTLRKGIPVLLETRQKMRIAKLGKPSNKRDKSISTEVRQKISASLKGRIQSNELKEKNRQGQYKRYLKINSNYIVATRNKRIAINGGFHSNNEWETLKAQCNWTCPCCHESEPKIILTKDHIIPLLRGGSNNIENIQPLCKLCNSKKHTQIIKY